MDKVEIFIFLVWLTIALTAIIGAAKAYDSAEAELEDKRVVDQLMEAIADKNAEIEKLEKALADALNKLYDLELSTKS